MYDCLVWNTMDYLSTFHNWSTKSIVTSVGLNG